jgi:hypothetical protein
VAVGIEEAGGVTLEATAAEDGGAGAGVGVK